MIPYVVEVSSSSNTYIPKGNCFPVHPLSTIVIGTTCWCQFVNVLVCGVSKAIRIAMHCSYSIFRKTSRGSTRWKPIQFNVLTRTSVGKLEQSTCLPSYIHYIYNLYASGAAVYLCIYISNTSCPLYSERSGSNSASYDR